MSAPWDDWQHVVKIDPDKSLVDGETMDDVCQSGTDAVAIGGTTGIEETKMETVVEACATHQVPLYLEPNAPDVAIDHAALDGYLIPTVFNTHNAFFTVGAHKEWARIEDKLPWEQITTEAYIVMNPEASVATYTDADCEQTPADVAAYATVAEQLFGQEIVYIEYSGTFGEPEVVAAAADATDEATLFYGGGIHDYETARTMAAHADVVIVGDLVHEEGVTAVEETVRGATDA